MSAGQASPPKPNELAAGTSGPLNPESVGTCATDPTQAAAGLATTAQSTFGAGLAGSTMASPYGSYGMGMGYGGFGSGYGMGGMYGGYGGGYGMSGYGMNPSNIPGISPSLGIYLSIAHTGVTFFSTIAALLQTAYSCVCQVIGSVGEFRSSMASLGNLVQGKTPDGQSSLSDPVMNSSERGTIWKQLLLFGLLFLLVRKFLLPWLQRRD
eukprot:NODE_1567_length_809_cov_87.958944_g1518_i0.p1 GENE.NODE_1567_length_809_cov_87.958944_g1518_i0~~NODE_1567_length_809_cov_87.958944_g1518_i0.p1  ORF type:complete len:210 (-),score=17.45 NODE_1567_length_809_cov_87.958944_g1518_i0:104-733(-)